MELIIKAKEMPNQILGYYNNLKIHKAIDLIMQLLRSVNKYLEVKAPWRLIKSNNDDDIFKASTTLYIAAELLKIGTILLHPIMPDKTQKLLQTLNVDVKKDLSFGTLNSNTRISTANNLFPRIEKEG
jgi:methionyl-tRNA synthetase